MKKLKVLSIGLFFVFGMLVTTQIEARDSYKTVIGTCPCGIDDYKCDTSDGSCNVSSQSICSEDCNSQ